MEEIRKPLVSYCIILLTTYYPCNWIQFEYQQAQLEREIENLSWKVERAETTTVAVSFALQLQNIIVLLLGYRT